MATWITHLILAERLNAHIPGLSAPTFARGNLGPDCNIPDDDWKTFTPPVEVTHFGETMGAGIHDLTFYNQHLEGVSPEEDNQTFSFLLGYFFHLIADSLWDEQLAAPMRDRYADQLESDPAFITEVKRDWYGLDFIYLRDHPADFIWQALTPPYDVPDCLDFLPPDTIAWKLNYIGEFYRRDDERVQALFDRPYDYLSQQQWQEFVDIAVSQLTRIYDLLWVDSSTPDSENATSALQWID